MSKIKNTIKKLTGWFFILIGTGYMITGPMFISATSFSEWTGIIIGIFFMGSVFFYVGWRLVTEETKK